MFSRKRCSKKRGLSGSSRLRLEPLEPRLLLSTFTVSTTLDEADGDHQPGDLSLREALVLAQSAPGDDAILFDAIGLGRMFNDGTKALNNVTLKISAGSFTSIVGPSGCGKSTLLRMLAGLDIPTAGALDWPAGRPGEGETGFVFQEATLLPWATVWENIYLPLRLAGRSRDAVGEDVAAVIALVGLEGFEQSFWIFPEPSKRFMFITFYISI